MGHGAGQLFLALVVLVALGIWLFVKAITSLWDKGRARERMKTMREEADAFFRDLASRKTLPVIAVNIVLQADELGILQETSRLYEARAYRVYGGAGTRIAGVFVGGGASESHQRLRSLDSGTLILTNKRLVFDGQMESRAVNLKDVLSAKPWSDAVEISSSRRQKSQVYAVSNPLIWAQMIQVAASGKVPVTARAPGDSNVNSLNDSLACVSRLLQLCKGGDQQQQAYEAAQEAYRRMPTAAVLYFRGATAAQVGKFADAEKDLLNSYEHGDDPQKWLSEQISRLNPEEKAALNPSWQHILCLPVPQDELALNLSQVYVKLGRPADAVTWAQRVVNVPQYRESALEIIKWGQEKAPDLPASAVPLDQH